MSLKVTTAWRRRLLGISSRSPNQARRIFPGPSGGDWSSIACSEAEGTSSSRASPPLDSGSVHPARTIATHASNQVVATVSNTEQRDGFMAAGRSDWPRVSQNLRSLNQTALTVDVAETYTG